MVGGQIAELPRLSIARAPDNDEAVAGSSPPPDAPLPPPGPRAAALEGMREVTRWNEITLFDVDEDDVIGVSFGGHARRLSCVDMGLATVRSRRPRDVFTLLKTICRGNGLFSTRAFGSRENGKRAMSELRAALRATFGLGPDPFEKYSFRERAWKTKFYAFDAPPAEVAARGALPPNAPPAPANPGSAPHKR